MSWPLSLLVSLVSAAAGLLLSGWMATRWVDWYRVSSVEGKSGYAVVGLALLGCLLGLIVGLVVSRLVQASGGTGLLHALGLSLAIVAGVVGAVGGAARLMADLPPRLDGKELLVLVEVRWPAAQVEPPAVRDDATRLRLASLAGSGVVRTTHAGIAWVDDLRREDDRWVLGGASELTSSRGRVLLRFDIDTARRHAAIVPLEFPVRDADREWSDWRPLPAVNAPAEVDGLSYRLRLAPRGEEVRRQAFGPFEVRTALLSVFPAAGMDRAVPTAHARFTVLHRGQPVAESLRAQLGDAWRSQSMEAVALLPGAEPALLVRPADQHGDDVCVLLHEQGAELRAETLRPCFRLDAAPITADVARFRAPRPAPSGRVDQRSFAAPGLYLLGRNLVLDTRTRRAITLADADAQGVAHGVAPLALAPDERSIVRVVDEQGDMSLLVTDLRDGESHRLPIDRLRMRYAHVEELDPAWVAHHFRWQRDGDGVDRLAERPDFESLPHRGRLTRESGDEWWYWVEPAGEPMRAALVAFLVDEMGGTRLEDSAGGYSQRVQMPGCIVDVSVSGAIGPVALHCEYGTGDSGIVRTIAERFDALLASGRHDALFAGA